MTTMNETPAYRTEQKWVRWLLLGLLFAHGILGVLAVVVIWKKERDRVSKDEVADFTWFLGQCALVLVGYWAIVIGVVMLI